MVNLRGLIVKFGLDKRPASPLLSETRKKQLAASNFIGYAIRKGKIKRPSICHRCFVKCRPNAHHPDYNKQNLVWWLCYSCHRLLHCHPI